MNERNLGYFSIDADWVRHAPEEVSKIFAMLKMVPVKADYREDLGAIEYLAIGERFREVPRGNKAPRYQFEIIRDSSGEITEINVEGP